MSNPKNQDIESAENEEIESTAAFRYAQSLYDYMETNSSLVEAIDLVAYGYPNTGDFVKVFNGAIRTDVTLTKIGLDKGQVGDAMTILKSMRCVTIIKRGGPKRPSMYVLHYQPTVKQYDEFRVSLGLASRRLLSSKYDQVLTENAEMRIRMKRIEEELFENRQILMNMSDAYKALANRTTLLEVKAGLSRSK